MNTYRFSLDPSSKKYSCPGCGHKTFVVFLETNSNNIVDAQQYGRCDRENSCGYYQYPSKDLNNSDFKVSNQTKAVENIKQLFPEESMVRAVTDGTNSLLGPFHEFMYNLGIPKEHLMKWGVHGNGDDPQYLFTVFLHRNLQGQVCNFKWFKYKVDGHRDQDFNSYSLEQPKSQGASTQWRYMFCLFGEHLLDPSKRRIVCVVESEKTAVMASYFYPQFDWVACGSNGGLTDGTAGKPDKVSPLLGRTVYWVCDSDKASRMRNEQGKVYPSSIRHLINAIDDFHIVDLWPDRSDGFDLGDAISERTLPDIVPTWSKTYVEDAEAKTFELDAFNLPKGVELSLVKESILKYSHFEHDGRIYMQRDGKRSEPSYFKSISNFTIVSHGLIDSQVEPCRIIEIKNVHDEVRILRVPTKAFASLNEFTVFIESAGNYQWDGTGFDLKRVRAKLYDTMETFEEVVSLGWHKNSFLFANGAYSNGTFHPIDRYGFVRIESRRYFIEPLSIITSHNSEDWDDERKFIYIDRPEITIKEWGDLFCKVYKENGIITYAWFVTSLFRDMIYARFKFFPHLFLFGPPGTGKSQVGWSIRSLGFTGVVKPFNLNTGTNVAFHREFANYTNFPAWCDEYDNGMPPERIQALKAAYDGVGHKKSVKDSDKRTKATQVNRSVLISGQQLPISDNALFKRVVLLRFDQTEFSAKENELFKALIDMEAAGLNHITTKFLDNRKLMEGSYLETFDVVMAEINGRLTKDNFEIEDRIARNSALILTTIKVLESTMASSLPFTYSKLFEIVVENMKVQTGMIRNATETNTFWDMVVYLIREGKIVRDYDFVVDTIKILKVNIGGKDVEKTLPTSTEVVYIRFTKIIPLYREHFKRQNNNNAAPMDKQSLMHYLIESKAYLGPVANVNFNGAGTRTSAHAFDYGILQSQGINLL